MVTQKDDTTAQPESISTQLAKSAPTVEPPVKRPKEDKLVSSTSDGSPVAEATPEATGHKRAIEPAPESIAGNSACGGDMGGRKPEATSNVKEPPMDMMEDIQTSTTALSEKSLGKEVDVSPATEIPIRTTQEETTVKATPSRTGQTGTSIDSESSTTTTQNATRPEHEHTQSASHATTVQSTSSNVSHGASGSSSGSGSSSSQIARPQQQHQLGPSSPPRAPRSSASAPAFTRPGPSSPTSGPSLPGQMFGQGRGRNPPSLPGPSNFRAQQYHPPHAQQYPHHQQQPHPPPIPLTPNLPSTSAPTLPTTEARDAIIASMSNLLDHKLQTRATQLHSNSAALAKQEADVARATEGLRKETAKLERVAKDAGRKVKELGNVQNWAEVLERDLLVIEETIRLANRPRRPRGGRGGAIEDGGDEEEYATSDEEGSERCSDCEGSCCWSGSGSGSGSEDGDNDRHSDHGEEQPATGNNLNEHAPQLSASKPSGVKIEINDELLASLSEAMRLDIYSDGKDSATSSSHGDPMDSGLSLASTSEQQTTPSLRAASGVGGGESPSTSSLSVDSRLSVV